MSDGTLPNQECADLEDEESEDSDEGQEVFDASQSDEERAEGILSILPVHDAPNTGKNALKVKRGPGRPRKVERMPTTSDLQYHAINSKKKQGFIATDPLVQAIEQRVDAPANLQRIKLEIAKEIASLHFQRVETEKYGRDTSQISSRRIDALERLAKIELKIREIDKDSINLGSEKMQKIFVLWVEVMREVAAEVLPPEAMDLFFNRFATAMEGWEEKAANVLR